MALKLKVVEERGYETYNTEENKKKNKEDAKAEGEDKAEEEQQAPVPLVTYVSNTLQY